MFKFLIFSFCHSALVIDVTQFKFKIAEPQYKQYLHRNVRTKLLHTRVN